MDLKMLLLKFGLIVLFYFPTVQLAKDTMEFSDFTFTWEDAEARCARQGQILVPGRRYRAKLLKQWMEKKNVQSIWLNGWRSVSDTIPDADGKLRTLKVDFSRPQNKETKLVCQIDSVFYDPLYVAKSTEEAREICARDRAVLADIKTEEDVKSVTEAIYVDMPNWVNSISSQGKSGYYITSKIKQCLIAERVGDNLKYNYADCSKEFNFICVTDDNLIASFSPLISLKMARYDEFEEEIEKHKQDMTSSFDLFESVSSTDIFLEMSSTKIMIQSTSTEVTSATPTKTLNQTTTIIQLPDMLTSKSPVLTSSESLANFTTSKVPLESTTERTPSIKPTEEYSEVTTSEMPVYITKKDIDTDMSTTDDISKTILSEKPPMSISFTSHVLETSVSEITVSSKSSAMVDSAGVTTSPETSPETKTTDVDVDLNLSSSSSDQDSFTITPSETFEILSPSSSLPVSDSSVDKSDSEFLPKSQLVTQSYNSSSFYTDMTIDAKSPYVDVIVTDPHSVQTSTVAISPSSTTDMKLSSTDDYDYTYDYEYETSSSNPLPDLETSETTEYTTETKPVETEHSTSEYIDMYSVTSSTSSVSSVYVDIPSSMSPFEKDILLPSEPTTSSFECTVIDATSYCPDATSTSATLDSNSLTQTSKPQTDRMMETFSSPPSSTLYVPIEIDEDGESSQPSSATPTTDVTSSTYQPDYDYEYPDKDEDKDSETYLPTTPKTVATSDYYDYTDEYDAYEIDDDADDKESESSETYMPMSTTPTTTIDYDDFYDSHEHDDDEDYDTMEKVDNEITGEIDIDETEDYNEAGNESGDTGEVVGKKAGEEDEGMEVGLWVAFGILILLVLVALILALYLYRRRKMQKSKDISATNGSAAAGATSGETVELRDSRSPSRENGQPRESTTFKDSAYDI